jgi:CRISPR-associated protein Csh1
MLEAIKDIGELQQSGGGSELETLVEDLAHKKNYSHMLLITFAVKAGVVTGYLTTGLEEIDSSRKMKYLYRHGASNGSDITPTSLITEPEKTLRTKIDNWISHNGRGSADPFLASLAKAYDQDHDRIAADVATLYSARAVKTGYGLTFLFRDEDGSSCYVGDLPSFRQFVARAGQEPGAVKREDHVCAVCGKPHPVVYGDIVPGKTLKFYTLDKPGYIASGFREENSWKNFPMCSECALALEAGTTYVDQHLNFVLGGARYYLVPKLVLQDKDVLTRILQTFRTSENVLRAAPSTDASKKTTQQQKFVALRQAEQDSERRSIAIMGDQSPRVAFDLLFYDKPQVGTFKILQLVQDVAPGQARRVAQAVKQSDAGEVFRDALPGDGMRRSVEFSFWQLAQFFKKRDSRNDETWKQEYLSLVADVFTAASADPRGLLHRVTQRLRDELLDDIYNQQGKTFSFEEWTLRGFNTILVLQRCQVVPTIYGEVKDLSELTTVSDQLFEGNSVVNTPARKAVFLTGALTQHLLNIQWQERRSKPFFKELKGLRMKEQDVKGLFPKIINKLEEYDKNYYGRLEQEAAAQFAAAGDDWDLTMDEINFIFALGMTLANRLTRKEKSDGADQQN